MNHAYANKANDQYRQNQIMTAPKKKLLIMLFDGAIKNLRLAELSIASKEIEKTNTYLTKTQNILEELMFTLNFDIGGDIAKNLYQLYEYMYNRLIRANIDKDVEGIREVKKHLEELRETWAQI